MPRPIKNTPYDRYMLESFQMQRNPNEVFQAINFQELIKGEKPIVSRATIYRRYRQWVKDGRPGELEGEYGIDDEGNRIIVYRLKKKG